MSDEPSKKKKKKKKKKKIDFHITSKETATYFFVFLIILF